jgi:hypothetical protein
VAVLPTAVTVAAVSAGREVSPPTTGATAPAASPTPAGSTAPAAPPEAGSAPAAEPALEATLLDPPPGFQPVPDAEAGTGALDVGGAVVADGTGGLTAAEFAALGLRGAHTESGGPGTGRST